MTDARATNETVLLVDGSSLVYRSFFAIPRLTNRTGLATNAVYGLATVLRKILAEERPAYAAVCFDARGATFRHDLYEEYKAHRPQMPDELAAQLPHARRLCEALGLRLLEVPGVEADDVIGTLAVRAAARGHPVLVVSSDKDFLQLVSDRITVVHPGKDVRYDPDAVRARFGVGPERIVDVLALMGDSVDNVPGVPGIGEKGASALVREWGSLENALAHAEEVKNKRQREGLTRHADDALLSKRLVRIATDVALPVELDELRYEGADRDAAFRLFEELGFTSLLKEYLPEETAAAQAPTIAEVRALDELDRLVERARAAGRLALALALSEAHPMRAALRGIGLAVEPGAALAVAAEEHGGPGPLLARLGPVLADPAVAKIGPDLKQARIVLARHGVELRGIDFDPAVAAYVLHPSKRSYDLATLAVEVLHRPLATRSGDEAQGVLPGLEPDGPSRREAAAAAERAEVALRLEERLRPRLEHEDLAALFRDLEIPLVAVLADMEREGIGLDVELLRSLSEEIGRELERLTAEIYELAGCEFNINSPKQLGEILFEKMNLPSFRKTQKQRQASTRVEVLEELAVHFELPRKILEYRTLAKLKGTYVDALPALVHPETGRIHTSFNQTVAATGRLSSSEPNLQNIPVRTELGRRIRSAFVARPGHLLLSADYSQIELRVLAHLSGDAGLVEAFEAGEDIHARTARLVFGATTSLPEDEQRRRAKIINFSIIYGKTAFTLAKEFGVSTREAQKFIDEYFERYPGVRELLDRIVREARRTGRVRTLFGRLRYIPEIQSRNRVSREAAERVAVNTPIQGTAADLIKKAMIDLDRELRRRGMRTRLLLQVHDELVCEVPEDEVKKARELVREVMEGVYPLAVPLRVDVAVDRSWSH